MNRIFNVIGSKIKNLKGENKTIFKNIILAFVIKGIALIGALYTLPGYLHYFSDQTVLGVWLTLVSILSWIVNFDLGIGNGLRNKIVEPLIKKDYKAIREYISSAYIILTCISVIAVVIGYITIPFINWNSFFRVSEDYISKVIFIKAVRIVLVGTLIQFVLRIITSILYAMQKSFVPNMLQLSSTILLLIFIYGNVAIGISGSSQVNLITLAYANILTVNLPLLITTLIVFYTSLKGCFPRLSTFKIEYACAVMKIGGVFFWLQIMFMLISNTNEFLITRFVGADNVVEYQIYNKLFTLSGTLVSLALTPIWSAVTKARVEQNFVWIRKLNKLLMFAGVIGIFFELLLIPVLQVMVNLWLGNKAIEVNYLYAVIFAVSGSLFLWNTIISAMTNGFGELKVQLIFLTIGAILNFPLAYIGSLLLNSYISIVIANIISLLPYCIIQPIWMKRYLDIKCAES